MSKNRKLKYISVISTICIANLFIFQNCSRISVKNLAPVLSNSMNYGNGESVEIDQAGNPISLPETDAPDGSSAISPGASSPTDPIVTAPVQTDSPLDECDGDLKAIDWSVKFVAIQDASI